MAAPRHKAQQIAARQREMLASYPAAMEQILIQWKMSAPEDSRGWLIYASSYLFNTQDVRWAIDPVRLKHRLPNAPSFDFSIHFRDLDFILLTHQHKDHFDLELIDQVKHLPNQWVIPEFLLPRIEELAGFPWERVVVPKPLLPFSLDGITITAFEGLHWEIVDQPIGDYLAGNFRGVPSLGYFVEFPGNRWLFPGDTRTYALGRIPDFGSIDLVFAHLWLGRRQALVEKPALLEDFCRFHQGLQPRQIILTHLGEFGRPPDSYWDLGHAQQVRAWFQENAPEISVATACSGDSLLG